MPFLRYDHKSKLHTITASSFWMLPETDASYIDNAAICDPSLVPVYIFAYVCNDAREREERQRKTYKHSLQML